LICAAAERICESSAPSSAPQRQSSRRPPRKPRHEHRSDTPQRARWRWSTGALLQSLHARPERDSDVDRSAQTIPAREPDRHPAARCMDPYRRTRRGHDPDRQGRTRARTEDGAAADRRGRAEGRSCRAQADHSRHEPDRGRGLYGGQPF
ncbi:hypothetical protein KXW38_001539, partial [Aspergillus fumigatus]